ncbi:MAG: hypothetical protein AAGA85_10695 [Bacteroidota bacterium]
MTKEKYIEDLQEIRSIMSRSSRFISLSGLSGIIAGVLALVGLYLAYETVYAGQDYLSYRTARLNRAIFWQLIAIASTLIVLAIGSGILLTRRKAQRENEKLWDAQSKRLLINLFIPLLTGGVLCIILLSKGLIGLVPPITLIFYGLALINASKYTLSEIRSLGIIEVSIGLVACVFEGYSLLFWGIGFGILHIIYGVIMHLKYDA